MSKTLNILLWWIIGGTKGGATRGRIILALKERPQNANQLTNLLELDRKTVLYHLNLLTDNKLLTTAGKRYGLMYFLSPELESSFKLFLDIWSKIKGKAIKEE